MFFSEHAARQPSKPAVVHAATGKFVSYRALDERSNRLAHMLRAAGLRRGDHVAIYMENQLRFMEVVWAAMRSGLYITPINRHYAAEEAAYVIQDCDAKAVVSSRALPAAAAIPSVLSTAPLMLMADGASEGWMPYEEAVAAHPCTPIADESAGSIMYYSSGTTGRPKGVKHPLPVSEKFETFPMHDPLAHYGFTADTIYLSTAPMYHGAPLNYGLGTHFMGGTMVMMEKFDPERALEFLERYRITHSQWVPTMFSRMLKLDESVRRGHDLSAHRVAIHAAAPCPPDVKKQMIDWWGPIVEEYYGMTEANGGTRISSREWLQRPGSVGRSSRGIAHICAADGEDLPPGEVGQIYFERPEMPFSYYKDPEKTESARHPVHRNWSTVGDIGYLDADGYLFLTDRAAFTIIAGGVNIYPQEIENVLMTHPMVTDAAVFGVPDPDMGEAVKAVVELARGTPGPELVAELQAYVSRNVARFMVPKTIDFIDTMPRLPTGKLNKKLLRDPYWKKLAASVVT